ncbi:CopG family transcriptional regulator [Subdoligranulum sp. DSM 109015]|uniref:CopG family transcriptional regulator n=2 Tax=Gemmiger gallinarum TaxID=2779354 RepID=A0ABR9R6K9_9FIRM|nr:CopG family transcriptional regulator [Gemmiger gallinarum]
MYIGGDSMDELKISKKTEAVMFTIRVDRSLLEFYDNLAKKTNRSRNELIGMALEFAKDKIKVKSDD